MCVVCVCEKRNASTAHYSAWRLLFFQILVKIRKCATGSGLMWRKWPPAHLKVSERAISLQCLQNNTSFALTGAAIVSNNDGGGR